MPFISEQNFYILVYLPLTIQMLIENNLLRQYALFVLLVILTQGYYGSLVGRDYLQYIINTTHPLIHI